MNAVIYRSRLCLKYRIGCRVDLNQAYRLITPIAAGTWVQGRVFGRQEQRPSRAVRSGDAASRPFRAVDRNHASVEQEKTKSTYQSLVGSLTVREQEVVAHVAAGLMNKQIAAKMRLRSP